MSFNCARHHKIGVSPRRTVIYLTLLAMLISGAAFAQRRGNLGAAGTRRAELAVSVSPDIAGLEESGPLVITLTNQNSSSDAQILPGDVFRLAFDIGNGRIESVGRVAIATSNTIKSSDFLATQGSGTAEILLTDTCAAVRFGEK